MSCLFFSACAGYHLLENSEMWAVKAGPWPSITLTEGLLFSPRHRAIAMPYILAFMNTLGSSFFCWDQLCVCEYFIVYSNGCGEGGMFGNQVHATEELCQTWELRLQLAQKQAMQYCTGNCSRICKVYQPYLCSKTQDRCGSFFTFSFPLQSLPLFAIFTTFKICFLPSRHLLSGVNVSKGQIWGKQTNCLQTASSLKPQVHCRSFSHCFASFYFSFYFAGFLTAALANQMRQKNPTLLSYSLWHFWVGGQN